MSGKIVMNLAMSVDGYIADEEGGYDWIVGHGNDILNTSEQDDYSKFLEDIDIVVMGKNSYDQGFAKDYPTKSIYVASHHKKEDKGNIHFINENIVNILEEEKKNGKNIYLFGGGKLIDSFLKENVIDEYIVGIIPIILGQGRPLFLDNNPAIPLQLNRYSISDGIIIVHYSKRR